MHIKPSMGTTEWYTTRNQVCKSLGLSKAHFNSVPLNLPEGQIKSFLEAAKRSEPWKAMKLVVLGHGRIGKSTLVHRLKEHVKYFHIFIVEFVT